MRQTFLSAIMSVVALGTTSVAMATPVTIDEKNFPDANFRSYISKNFDTNADGSLSDAEQAAVEDIAVPYKEITSLKGIEKFKNLYSLDCQGNSITELDLSANPDLFIVKIGYNKSMVKVVFAKKNSVNTLSIAGDKSLEGFSLADLPNLMSFDCESCSFITELDFTKTPWLQELNCSNCNITNLDLTKAPNLTKVKCYQIGNQSTKIETLKAANLKHLTQLVCYGNNLQELDLSGCVALENLDCQRNSLKKLKLSGCTWLDHLNCSRNSLQELDLSAATYLTYLDCYDNQLSSLNVADTRQLTFLNCGRNHISSLLTPFLTELTELVCHENCLPGLDISNNTKLKSIACNDQVVGIASSRWKEFSLGNILLSHVSNVEGGSKKDGKFVPDEGSSKITYDYNVGNAQVAFSVTIVPSVEITEEAFPDINFRRAVANQMDLNGDRCLDQREMKLVTTLDASGLGITSLKGLELLTELGYLYVGHNAIGYLDPTVCPKLLALDRADNVLEAGEVGAKGFVVEGLDVAHVGKVEGAVLVDGAFRPFAKGAGQFSYVINFGHSYHQPIEGRPGWYTSSSEMTVTVNYVMPITPSDFADKAFATYVFATYDADSDGRLSPEELSAITSLSIRGLGVKSLQTNFQFGSLTSLDCSCNEGLDLDNLSDYASLTSLVCDSCGLKTLDVSALSKLENLSCCCNNLLQIDLKSNTELVSLACDDNNLTGLDLSQNTKIKSLQCERNGHVIPYSEWNEMASATSFILWRDLADRSYFKADHYNVTSMSGVRNFSSHNTGFRFLADCFSFICEYDTKSKVEGCSQMTFTYVVDNVPVSSSIFKSAQLLDVAKKADLDGDGFLSVAERDSVRSLDLSACGLKDLTGINVFSGLEHLDVSSNRLTDANLGGLSNLESVNASRNFLTSLDFCSTHIQKAEDVNISDNVCDFGAMNLSWSAYIANDYSKVSDLYNCTLEASYLSPASDTTTVMSYAYEMGRIGDSPLLGRFYVSVIVIDGVHIEVSKANFPDDNFRAYVSKAFDTDGNGVIEGDEIWKTSMVDCSNKDIKSLRGIELFPDLQILYCSSNMIDTLDLSRNTRLSALSCFNNNLDSLCVGSRNLTNLACYGNSLDTLIVSDCFRLEVLHCEHNNLESLDLSNNVYLDYLDCSDNSLVSLDLSNQTRLSSLVAKNLHRTAESVDAPALPSGLDESKAVITNEVDEKKFHVVTYTYPTGNPKFESLTFSYAIPLPEQDENAISDVRTEGRGLKAVKRILDGRVVIDVAGDLYDMAGHRVR